MRMCLLIRVGGLQLGIVGVLLPLEIATFNKEPLELVINFNLHRSLLTLQHRLPLGVPRQALVGRNGLRPMNDGSTIGYKWWFNIILILLRLNWGLDSNTRRAWGLQIACMKQCMTTCDCRTEYFVSPLLLEFYEFFCDLLNVTNMLFKCWF